MSSIFNINSISLGPIDEESELIPLMTSDDEEAISKEKLPESLPILPLRNTVLFPGVVIPITVSRDKSISLINNAYKQKKVIGVVAQKNPDLESRDDLNNLQAFRAELTLRYSMPLNIIGFGIVISFVIMSFGYQRKESVLKPIIVFGTIILLQIISIVSSNGESSNYLIPKGKHVNFNQGEKIKKGEYLLDGSPAPHDILRILGVEKLTEYFVTEVQEVYRLQGVVINDKHIETIVRQMLKRVEVKDPGDSELLTGEVIDLLEINIINDKIREEKKKPATFERVLLGITKASLQTNSFISAASFQETTRVLTDAAIKGKVDKLSGLKENVIVGRLVPAGTGSVKNLWNKKARLDDEKFIAENEKIEQAESPVNQ